MISREIDLTANSQFSGGTARILPNVTTVTTEFLERVANNGNMSTEEFDALLEWERFFRPVCHGTRKWSIFLPADDDAAFEEKMRSKCPRCGKEIRIPWERVSGLCRKCNEETRADWYGTKIPWEQQFQFGDLDENRRIIDNVFSLR